PEAQLDRFLFKIDVGYPSPEEEAAILAGHHAGRTSDRLADVQAVMTAEDVAAYQGQVRQIHIEGPLLTYIAGLVYGTRNHRSLYLGASPRASIAILQASKAFAAMRGRDFVTPEDIQEAAYPALCHRILLTPEEEMEGGRPESVIERIIGGVEVPR
ncbi:MAG: AAA family ATPase, partial [Rhodothermales bacterium]